MIVWWYNRNIMHLAVTHILYFLFWWGYILLIKRAKQSLFEISFNVVFGTYSLYVESYFGINSKCSYQYLIYPLSLHSLMPNHIYIINFCTLWMLRFEWSNWLSIVQVFQRIIQVIGANNKYLQRKLERPIMCSSFCFWLCVFIYISGFS